MSLEEFRQFIYGSYSDTHAVYSNTELSESAGRQFQFRHFLQNNLPPNKATRVLDFGCGDGSLLNEAEGLGYLNLTGVDVSAGMISLAQSKTSAAVHAADGLAFLAKCEEGAFDVIIAFDVLEHFTRPELLTAAKTFFRALSVGGTLLLHLPNGASPFHGRIRWGDVTHEQAFTRNSLAQVLEPVGFKNIAAYEDAPITHGLKSLIRTMLWKLLRIQSVTWLVAETGQLHGHLLTQNIFVTATKTTN